MIKLAKLFLLVILIFTTIISFGCSNEDLKENPNKTEINNYLTDLIVRGNSNIVSDLAFPTTFIELYYMYKEESYNIDLYECCFKENNLGFIAGYVEKNTIDLIDSDPIPDPLETNFYIQGVNEYLYKYQKAVHFNLLNTKENPIYYRYFEGNEIPVNYENKTLILVLKKQVYTAENLNKGDLSSFNNYLNVIGNIEDDLYILKDIKNNTINSFLMTSNQLNKDYVIEIIKDNIVFIHKYNNINCIFESCSNILNWIDIPFYDEYIKLMKNFIISSNTEITENTTLIYNYEKLKEYIVSG